MPFNEMIVLRFFKHASDARRKPSLLEAGGSASKDAEYEYLIAEIQHSTREDTIRAGIKETLEYLAFLQVNEEYVFGRDSTADPSVFGSGWNGLLVVQDLDQETPSVDEQGDEPITILQAGELDAELSTVLRGVLER